MTSVERRRSGAPLRPPASATAAKRPGPRERRVGRDQPVEPWSATTPSDGVDLRKPEVGGDLEQNRDARLALAEARSRFACVTAEQELPQAGLVLQLPQARGVRARDVEDDR
jgi:hypothetical protein